MTDNDLAYTTFTDLIAGPAFKVVSDATGQILRAFDTLAEAQAYADEVYRTADTPHHCRVVEVRWCGGSKRLSDLSR